MFDAEIFSSLKVRILGGIFFIFFLAMGMVLYGVWTYQRDKLIEMSSQRAVQMSELIVAGLRSSMLQNDRAESMKNINTILGVADTSRISILNSDGKISMTSDPAIVGAQIDVKTNPSCRPCHNSRAEERRKTAFIEYGGEKYISSVTSIRNEPACFGCHAENQKIIGILLVESSFSRTTAMLKALAQRIVLAGILAFIVGALFLNYIVTRFFTRPLNVLQHGFEQVGNGDFSYWVDVKSGGEIGYMADSFNVMSRAIGRYVSEIEEKNEEVSAHYTIVHNLSQTIDKKKLQEVVVDLLSTLLGADSVALALAVERHDTIFEMTRIQKNDKRHYHEYYNTNSGELDLCALQRKDLVEWIMHKMNAPVYCDNGNKVLIPLQHEKMKIGLLSVVKPEGMSFGMAERKIIPVLNHHVSISFANAQLYNMAITDGLTTLYTKRHFWKKIDDFIESFHTTKRGFCLMMIDLDHFKRVNDTHGHSLGDAVLVHVADIIRAVIRHGDLPFRYGGEEFIVLLKGDDLEGAIRIAERVRQEIERKPLELDEITSIQNAASIGLACFPHHFTSAQELVDAADSALYKAKRNGRNQVAVYCQSISRQAD